MRALIKRLGGALVLWTGALACLLAVSPAAVSAKGHKTCKAPRSAWKFHSTKLRPARIHVCTRKHGTAPGMVFLDPFHNAQFGSLVGQAGALMVDQGGNPVWFHPAPKGEQDSNFETQKYGASQQPVLTFWQGVIAIPPKHSNLPAGSPVKGAFHVYNNHYQGIKTIKAVGKGWITDFHELILTPPTAQHPQGTAIFFAAKLKSKNLRKYGGQAKGHYEDQEIQQVDLAHPKKLLFHWDVDAHIKLSASRVHAPRRGPWDPYHANSINLAKAGNSLAPVGDMLVSLRNTWGAYDLTPSGAIRWRLINGKGTNFKVSKSGRFFWQHDVRFAGKNKVSMFDDGCCNLGISGPEHAARGLVLSLNKGKKSAGVVHQYHHANTAVVPTSGSLRFLSNGHAFIGWGQSWYYSEYAGPKSLVYDAAMPKPDMSYRANKAKWSGTPTTKPSAVVRHSKGKTTAYASWNGATGVASWTVFGGSSASKQTKKLGHSSRKGFETAIRLSGQANYYKVEALDSHGHVLAKKVIKG